MIRSEPGNQKMNTIWIFIPQNLMTVSSIVKESLKAMFVVEANCDVALPFDLIRIKTTSFYEKWSMYTSFGGHQLAHELSSWWYWPPLLLSFFLFFYIFIICLLDSTRIFRVPFQSINVYNTCIHLCIYICVCVYIYIYVCVWIYC